jgi:hypothetical protein
MPSQRPFFPPCSQALALASQNKMVSNDAVELKKLRKRPDKRKRINNMIRTARLEKTICDAS